MRDTHESTEPARLTEAGESVREDVPTVLARPAGESAPTAEAIAHEALLCRRLQRAVDLSLALIYQDAHLDLCDSIEIVLHVRRISADLFPGREATFDLLYRPRLMRAIRERFGIEEVDDLSRS